jgi:hypothetical protein
MLEEASGGSLARDRGGSFARSSAPPSLVSSQARVALQITATFYFGNP